MLLMVRADAAIVRAAINSLGMWFSGIFRGFIIIANLLVVLDVVSDEYLLKTVLFAIFSQIYTTILQNNFGIDGPMANIAEAGGVIVIDV
jgi:hypothetical protein